MASQNKHLSKGKLSSDGIIDIPTYDNNIIKIIKLFPGAFFDENVNKWRVSTKQKHIHRIIELNKLLKLDLDDYWTIKETEQELLARKSGLYKYQIEGVSWLVRQDNCLLADYMGAGKTITTLFSLNVSDSVMIVAPSHLKNNWEKEIKKWRPEFNIKIINKKSEFSYPKSGEIVITTYGLIPEKFITPKGKRINKNIINEDKENLSKTIIIFDEVHYLKNNKSKQHIKCKLLAKLSKKSIGLTGTPILNKPTELWNILCALKIEKEVFENFMSFVYLFNGKEGFYGYEFGMPKPEVSELLKNVMLRRTRKDIEIELPDEVFQEILSECPNKISKELDNIWEFYKKSDLFTKGELPEITEISKIKKELAISKIPVLIEVVKNLEESGICPIVFSAHRDPVITIGKMDGWKYITGLETSKEKFKIAEEFQNGKLKGLALTIKACGTGLTLTRTNYIVFNDLDWVPANNSQARARINRISQKSNKCHYYHIVANHPLDKHIFDLLIKKMKLENLTLNSSLVSEDNNDNELYKTTIKKISHIWIKKYGKKKMSYKKVISKKEDLINREDNVGYISKLLYKTIEEKGWEDEISLLGYFLEKFKS